MNMVTQLFFVLSAIVWAGLFAIFLSLFFSKVAEKKYFMFPIGMAMLTIPIYAAFIVSKTYRTAMVLDGLYFACTDWLCFFMMMYVYVYTGLKGRLKPVCIAHLPLIIIDTISLVVNAWTNHTFNLHLAWLESGISYWSWTFTWPHYIHLALCYVMVLNSLVVLFVNAVNAPWSYKRNYVGILLAFVVVIISNVICYSQDLVVDFSVLLYPLLGAFIYYYSLYSVPQKLLSRSLKSVNETINDAILYFDVNDECIYKNSNAASLFLEDDEFSVKAAESFQKKIREKSEKTAGHAQVEFFIVNGEERQFEVEFEDIYYGYNLIGSYLKLTDKTDEINKFLTQKFLATHDELTGAYNRDHFFEMCDARMKEHPETERLMISTNIRQFKLLNELFGEETGNKVLLKMVTSAKTIAIHDSILGRVGDDRFALFVLKEHFKEEYIDAFLSEIQSVLNDSMYKINISVGICPAHGDTESSRLLYDKTQIAMKKIGDDYQRHFAYYDSDLMDELLRERQITAEFERSIERGEICMYLQPFVNSRGDVFGAEALARWLHPERGLLLPEVFIPTLERTGLIHKLDAFMWEGAARKLSEWRKQKIENMHISVNVSEKDIFYIDIAQFFKQLLLKYDFDPKNLKIEFTETTLTNDPKGAVELFSNLKRMGFEVGIDDFGHGYSSLNLLKDINADILKIDMVLLQKTENSARAKIILNFIMQLSRALGMKLISEGVETADQLEMLKQLGCGFFQGFLFSNPIPVGEFEKKYIERP